MGANGSKNSSDNVGDYSVSIDDPLCFHCNHGDNVQLSNRKKKARRIKSFCKGFAFSNRPISINEMVHLKQEYAKFSWSGALRLGCTSVNPSQLVTSSLPKYAGPHLTAMNGYWVKAIPEHLQHDNIILSFYVNNYGQLCLYSNGQDAGVLVDGISTTEPLWVIMDIYGNTCGVEFIEQPFSIEIDNSRRNLPNMENRDDNQADVAAEEDAEQNPACEDDDDRDLDRPDHDNGLLGPVASTNRLSWLLDELHSGFLDLSDPSDEDEEDYDTHSPPQSPPNRIYSSVDRIHPKSFSTSHGHGISIGDGQLARKIASPFAQVAIVFTAEPLVAGRSLHFQVISSLARSNLCIGVTSCNPFTLDVNFLPTNSYDLVDRKEYWVLGRIGDVVGSGDHLAVTVYPSGWVKYKVNSEEERNLFFCDSSLVLWLFIDLEDYVEEIRFIGESGETPVSVPSTSRQLLQDHVVDHDQPHPSSSVVPDLPDPVPAITENLNRVFFHDDDDSRDDVAELRDTDVISAPNLGISLNPDNSSSEGNNISSPEVPDVTPASPPSSSDTSTAEASAEGPTSSGATSPQPDLPSKPEARECSICYNEEVDAAIYDCGHVCLCVECGENLRSRFRVPLCPICRKPIKDIIRLFHS